MCVCNRILVNLIVRTRIRAVQGDRDRIRLREEGGGILHNAGKYTTVAVRTIEEKPSQAL